MGILTKDASYELYDEAAAAFGGIPYDPEAETVAVVEQRSLTKVGHVANMILRAVHLPELEVK